MSVWDVIHEVRQGVIPVQRADVIDLLKERDQLRWQAQQLQAWKDRSLAARRAAAKRRKKAKS
jgi:hypothetical protein